MNVMKDSPLSEITLRRYEKPYDMDKRELIKKLCLSIGLLQPGDSRDIIVDVFSVLLNAAETRKMLDSETIREEAVKLREKYSLPLKGVASSNIRRQLKRLRDIFLVEKVNNNYRITEFDELSNIFSEKIEKFYLENITTRVKEYFEAIK